MKDVQRGKPDPEVYLLAASRVSVSVERCIVVEDARTGRVEIRFDSKNQLALSNHSTKHADCRIGVNAAAGSHNCVDTIKIPGSYSVSHRT